MKSRIEVRVADLSNEAEANALVEIIDSYARGPGGQNAPISEVARRNMAAGLLARPHATVLMAFHEGAAVGVAVCVETFSTFAGRPAMNLHDLAVLPAHQGCGIGTALLAEMAQHARQRGCCKLTLEVHEANTRARALYEQVGFGPWDQPTYFVTKPLDAA